MFYHFGALPHEIPLVIWNPCYFQPVESFQSSGSEPMKKVNENC